MARVWVAMSGGVDSSVAAALLIEEGHEVTGVTMQLWPSGTQDNGCCSQSAVADARRVCDRLEIPHYTLNFRESFEREVVMQFAREYSLGHTPNPCIDCNARLKFSELLAKVSAQGADALATGHYARVVRDPAGRPWLARGVDATKDQSYFLYRMTQTQLDHVLFPVGALAKTDVRAIADRLGLSVAHKPDSQDLCFATTEDHLGIVRTRMPQAFAAGDIVDTSGHVVGRHTGIAAYTVGQRKGIGLGGMQHPQYVVRIDASTNQVIVGPREALTVSRICATDTQWCGDASGSVDAMVRYRMPASRATAAFAHGSLVVEFQQPLFGVAPGQSVVCYRGDIVLGGGVIACAS